jgi:hypothetical protein
MLVRSHHSLDESSETIPLEIQNYARRRYKRVLAQEETRIRADVEDGSARRVCAFRREGLTGLNRLNRSKPQFEYNNAII